MSARAEVASFALACTLALACNSDVRVLHDVAADAGALNGEDAGDPTPTVVVRSGRRLAAFEHSCAARSDGLFCWGPNASGQLGVGDTLPRTLPVAVPGLTDVRDVCVGEEHTCALSADGTLQCWGQNVEGQLGIGSRASALAPRTVAGTYLRVSCGGYDTCAVDVEHTLWCWGDNMEGQVGVDGAEPIREPARLALAQGINNVSVGQGHVCAVDVLGELWCWGRNTESQLGLDSAVPQLRVPTRIGTDRDFRLVSTSQQHTCAVRHDTSLWCWGSPAFGKLGGELVSVDAFATTVAVSDSRGFSDVTTSWFHTCALHGAGTIACFGRNTEGQLGLGDTTERSSPNDLDEAWDEVVAGRFHTCARRAEDVFCWGKNDAGQLGLGDDTRRDVPVQLAF